MKAKLLLGALSLVAGCENYVDTTVTYKLEGVDLSTGCIIEEIKSNPNTKSVTVNNGYIALEFRSYRGEVEFVQEKTKSRNLNVSLTATNPDKDALTASARELYDSIVANCILL